MRGKNMDKSEVNVSPEGEIVSMKIDQLVANRYKEGRQEVYIRLMFDGTTAEGLAFREKISQLNPAKIVTRVRTGEANGAPTYENLPAGKFIVNFTSIYPVTVKDCNGVELTEKPTFWKGIDTGKARVQYKTDTRGKAGTLYLQEVGITALQIDEKAREEAENNRTESQVSALTEVLRQHHG